MKVRDLSLLACLTLACSWHAGPSQAAPLTIDFEGAINGEFTVADPAAFTSNTSGGYFYYTNVPGTSEGVSEIIPYLEFFTADNLGGLSAASDLMSRNDSELDLEGPQLFSGPVTNPEFRAGSFDYPLGEITETVTVSGVPGLSNVPLPASAPLFGVALVALGAAGFGVKRRAGSTA